MSDRTDHLLAAIDGALADAELPDGMRWSPEPETVKGAPAPFDGTLVWQPPQRYEQAPADPPPFERPACDAPPARYPLTPPWVEAQRARRAVEPLFSDHQPSPALDLTWSLRAEAGLAAAVAAPGQQIAIRAASEAEARRAYQRLRVELMSRDRPPSMREVLLLRMLDNPQETAAAINRAFEQLIEALRPVVEQIGRNLADLGRALADAIPGGPPPAPAAEDPRARALRLRRQRGTGPDRQIQHRPGPRRHQ
jgi:hypothetical protein